MANGGRYLGFCLGGYLAGHDPGYSLLSPDDDAVQEIEEPGSQVRDEDDTIIQAALLSPFGRGWAGCVGPHPEADQSWCKILAILTFGEKKLLCD